MQVTVLTHADGSRTVIERHADDTYVVRDFTSEETQIGGNDNHGANNISFRDLFDTASRPGDSEAENYVGYESYETLRAAHADVTSYGYQEPD